MAVLRKSRVYALVLMVLLVLWYWNADFIGRLIYPVHYKEEIMHSAGLYLVDPFVITASSAWRATSGRILCRPREQPASCS